MAGLDISTGALQAHDNADMVQPLDPSATPGVQQPTAIQPGQLSGPTIPGRDVHGEWAEQMAIPLAECQAAMTAGMSAETGRRDGYEQELLPLGSSPYQMGPLPVVPEDATAPSNSFLYPEGGLQPTPESAGFYPGYHGNEPGQ